MAQMIRESFTAVLEKNTVFASDFATEPYETGWASEARWFIRVLECDNESEAVHIYAQLSPDGLFWCDAETIQPLTISEPGLYSFPMRDFGHWLRLRAEFPKTKKQIRVLIYLALKV